MPRRRRKALPAASRSPAIAPRLSAPRRLRRHCGPRAYRRVSFRPRRRRRVPAGRPIASGVSCCPDDDPDWALFLKPAPENSLAGLRTRLAAEAEKAGVALAFEAAVAGGIPVIKTLRESLAGNRLARVYGILNGTSNYILTTMRETGREFAEVLAEAQKLGYAEADPSFDIDGVDAAHKLAILASVGFGRPVDLAGVYTEGIRHISRLDIDFAEELGFRIKLLGIARMTDHGLEQRVHPCMVPRPTPIAAVEGVFNAVVAEGDFVGRVVLEGRGAGAFPTASSVAADLVDIAAGRYVPAFGVPAASLEALPGAAMERHQGAYYIRLMVVDQPGVIADVAAALRDEKVSLESMIQRGRAPGEAVPVVLTTHDTVEAAMRRAIDRITALDSVLEPPRLIRIEDF